MKRLAGLRAVPSISGVALYRPTTNTFGGSRISGARVAGISIIPHRHPDTGAVGCTIGLAPFLGVTGYSSVSKDAPPVQQGADALHTAASVAADVAGMLDEHPMLNALLPPGTGVALKGVALASQALKQGYSLNDVAKNVGPSTARVLNNILSLF